MKIEQNQVWEKDGQFLRIVQRERLEVQYKSISTQPGGQSGHHRVTKKEFCRLIKGAKLLSPAEARAMLHPEEGSPPSNP